MVPWNMSTKGFTARLATIFPSMIKTLPRKLTPPGKACINVRMMMTVSKKIRPSQATAKSTYAGSVMPLILKQFDVRMALSLCWLSKSIRNKDGKAIRLTRLGKETAI